MYKEDKKRSYTEIDGIKCYAPELAMQNQDYPPDMFDFMYRAEENNFWFISRNRIIQHLFRRFLGESDNRVLEIGCGTGYVLKGLRENFPAYGLMGSEIHLNGIKVAQKRLPGVELIQLDATEMPFDEEFDAIGAFDVLEHIEEDESVMRQTFRALRPDGCFLITVPQYNWLWSNADDIAFHKRRYSKKELRTKLEHAGFEVSYIGSFVFTLFPMMLLSRLSRSNRKRDHSIEDKKAILYELELPKALNAIFLWSMRIDELLIESNISLPFGGSLIAVARKKDYNN